MNKSDQELTCSVVSPPQPATVTFTPDAVVSTWSCTNCRGGRAEESASTVGTTQLAVTVTTARRATTEICPNRSHTGKRAKVQRSILGLVSSGRKFVLLFKRFPKTDQDVAECFGAYLR